MIPRDCPGPDELVDALDLAAHARRCRRCRELSALLEPGAEAEDKEPEKPTPMPRSGRGPGLVVASGAALSLLVLLALNLGVQRSPPGSVSAEGWRPMALRGAPEPRQSHSATWSPQGLVVFGGTDFSSSKAHRSGAVYDPARESWEPLPFQTDGRGRRDHLALWLPEQRSLFVWGGRSFPAIDDEQDLSSGARLALANATWTPTTDQGAPRGRLMTSGAWMPAARRVLIYGGTNGEQKFSDVALYDPAADTWTELQTPNGAPNPGRNSHSLVRAGDNEVIVFGGDTGPSADTNSGGIFDIRRRDWSLIWTDDSARRDPDRWIENGIAAPYTEEQRPPRARVGHCAVWIPERAQMIVWGGSSTVDGLLADGGIFDRVNRSWSPIPAMENAPAARRMHRAVAYRGRMIIHGGLGAAGPLGDAWAFDPQTMRWEPLTTDGAPGPRVGHSLTLGRAFGRDLLFVWGGRDARRALNSGAALLLERW